MARRPSRAPTVLECLQHRFRVQLLGPLEAMCVSGARTPLELMDQPKRRRRGRAAAGAPPLDLAYWEQGRQNPLQNVLVTGAEKRLRAMRAAVLVGGYAAEQQALARWGKIDVLFLRLSYRQGEGYEPRHIRRFLDVMSQHLRRQLGEGVPVIWVAELQEKRLRSGAPPIECVHYHVMVWVPRGFKLPKPDTRKHSGRGEWWPHGSSRVEKSYSRSSRYLAKYASKGVGDSSQLPKGIRLYGVRGLEGFWRGHFEYWQLPAYVRDRCCEAAPAVKVGDSWRLPDGTVLKSEWEFVGCRGGVACIRPRMPPAPVGRVSTKEAGG